MVIFYFTINKHNMDDKRIQCSAAKIIFFLYKSSKIVFNANRHLRVKSL